MKCFKRSYYYLCILNILLITININSYLVKGEGQLDQVLNSKDEPPLLNKPNELMPYALSVAQKIEINSLKEHVRFFSGLLTREPGSQGYYKAAEYIKSKFQEYGLVNISYMEFSMAMPISYGASLTILRPSLSSVSKITLYPLQPNVVCPSTGTYEGQLIYAGFGSYKELNGINTSGAIALLEYASGRNWINPFALGCQAVILIEPGAMTIYDNLLKTSSVAANLPRFYIKQNDALFLRKLLSEGPASVRIESKVIWERIPAINVLGYIKGVIYPDQILLLVAHFDTFSVVQGLAPGANEAQGVASLLELARFYSQNPPARTIMFLAVSGHWQSYYGMREFIERFYFGNYTNIGSKIRLAFYLDFYTQDSNSLVVGGTGPVASSTGIRYSKYTDTVYRLIFTEGSPSFKSYMDPATPLLLYQYGAESITSILQDIFGDGKEVVFKVGDGIFWALASWISPSGTTGLSPFIWDAELLMAMGPASLYIASGSTSRILERTPLDTFDTVNFENLNHVLKYTFNLIFFFANTTKDVYEKIPEVSATRYDPNMGVSFIKLQVQVLEYDQVKSGWYKPVPGALVLIYQGASGYGTYVYGQQPNTQIIEMADENGLATFNGLRSAFISLGAMFSYNIEAYVVDSETGNLLYAPNLGTFTLTEFPNPYTPNKAEERISTNVLKTGTIVLFEVYSPLEAPIAGYGSAGLITGSITIQALDATSFSKPFFYGLKNDGILGVSAVYAQPDQPIMVEYMFPGKLLGLLRNCSGGASIGEGYKVGYGERLTIPFTSLRVALDTWLLDERRLAELNSRYVFSAGGKAENYHASAAEHLRAALQALNESNYDRVFGESWKAWSYEALAYDLVKRTTLDTVTTACFFIALAIPFAFLFERLVVGSDRGWYRLLTILGTIAVLVALLGTMHPGFILASNISMVLLGTAIIFLLLPVIAITFSEFRTELKRLREALGGIHTAGISSASAIMMAFSAGTSYQRKRRLRTVLSLITVVTITFALVTMVSVSTFAHVIRLAQPIKVAPPYQGLLFRDKQWQAIPPDHFKAISSAFSSSPTFAVIAPRVWWYPPYTGFSISQLAMTGLQQAATSIDQARTMSKVLGLKGKNGTLPIYVVWGLSPEEVNITGLKIVDGKWIEPCDQWVVILTVEDARTIGVSVGDSVEFYGFNFTVKGLVNATEIYIYDIDGEPITPISFVDVFYEKQARLELTDYRELHHKPKSEGSYIIVPYNIAIDLGGSIVSIALKIKDPEVTKIVATELADKLAMNVYLAIDNSTFVYRKGALYSTRGSDVVIIPLIIGVFTLTSTIMGVVYERTREMSIFSSIGMNPSHIVGIFLAENLIIAILGAVMGYLVGIFIIYLGVPLGGVGTMILPNYSSSYVLISVGISIAATISACLYPLYKSSRLVTPSLERKWKLPAPKGNNWQIPMPFACESDTEVLGVFEYLKEYLNQYRDERMGTFMVREGKLSLGLEEGARYIDFVFNVSLAPYEQGVTQEALVRAKWSHRIRAYNFELRLIRLTGPSTVWRISNPRFIDVIRKQLLMWRLLTLDVRNRYIEQAKGRGPP